MSLCLHDLPPFKLPIIVVASCNGCLLQEKKEKMVCQVTPISSAKGSRGKRSAK